MYAIIATGGKQYKVAEGISFIIADKIRFVNKFFSISLNFFLLFYRYNFKPVSVRICDKIQTAEQLFSYGKISMRCRTERYKHRKVTISGE